MRHNFFADAFVEIRLPVNQKRQERTQDDLKLSPCLRYYCRIWAPDTADNPVSRFIDADTAFHGHWNIDRRFHCRSARTDKIGLQHQTGVERDGLNPV